MKYTKTKYLAAAALLSAAVLAQAALIPEDILPENTAVVLSLRDACKGWNELMTTPVGALLKDPAMKPFCNYFAIKSQEAINSLSEELVTKDINLDSIKDILAGGGSFSISNIETGNKNGNFSLNLFPLLMLETKGDSAAVKEQLSGLTDKLMTFIEQDADKVPKLSSQQVAGIDFTVIEIDAQTQLWYGLAPGNILAVTSTFGFDDADADFTKRAITEVFAPKAGQKRLAETREFKSHDYIQRDRDYMWINFAPVLDAVKAFVVETDKKYVAPSDPMEAMMAMPRPMAIYNALGLEAFKSLGAASYVVDGESYGVAKLICPQRERRGVSALLDAFEVKDCAPAEILPANITAYKRTHINPQKLWETIDSTSTEVAGGIKMMGVSMIENILSQSETPIDLKKGILDNMTGEIIEAIETVPVDEITEESVLAKNNKLLVGGFVSVNLRRAEGDSDSSSLIGETILLGVKDPDAFINTVRAAVSCVKEDPEEVDEILSGLGKVGSKYVSIRLGGLSSDSFLSKGAPEKKLVNCKALQNVIAKAGGFEQTSLSYLNLKLYCGTIYKFISIITADGTAEDLDVPEEVIEAIKMLPEFSEIEKYLGITVSTAKVTPEGVECTTVTPWPESLER